MSKLSLLPIQRIAIALLVIAVSFSSCKKSADTNAASGKRHLSAVTGRTGEVVIVVSKDIWNSSLGEKFREILADEYPYLPQPEPSFKLVSIPQDMFSSLFKTHRSLILVEFTNDGSSEAKMFVQHDVWATPQIVIKCQGPSVESIVQLLDSKGKQLYQLLDQMEIDRNTMNARRYANPDYTKLLHDKFGINLSIPADYDFMLEKDDFIWFEYNTNFTKNGILVYAYPYTKEDQFSREAQIAKRNEVLKKYVPSTQEGSYMTTTTYIEPEYTKLTFRGVFMGKMRGFWEVEKGYMGGPFISYSTIVGNNIVTVEGFVHAPKTEKRDYLRQVAGIALSIIPEQAEPNDTGEKKE